MAVIHPSLFSVIKRFPDHRDAMRAMYMANESYQSLCHNYQKCEEALEHWTQSKHADAPERQREYAELLKDLEFEIVQSLGEGF